MTRIPVNPELLEYTRSNALCHGIDTPVLREANGQWWRRVMLMSSPTPVIMS